MSVLRLRRPDDWHLHVRDGALLRAVLPFSARQFGRAIIMPNLKPPVCTAEEALAYRERILAALGAPHQKCSNFEPLMTLYLTDATTPEHIAAAKATNGRVVACKLYPAHATTNSQHGVTDITRLYPTLRAMAAAGLPLLVHGEVTDPEVDVFDREAEFIEKNLRPLLAAIPDLRVVLEHCTTREAAELVATFPEDRLAATVTAHHLLENRNALFRGGLRPHMYCLPVLKAETHRQALLRAVTGEKSHRFFLGTDSAPHLASLKESDCGCAGVFTAPCAVECYAEAFDKAGALDKLEAFASLNGPRFYGLPPNEEMIELHRTPCPVPATVAVEDGSGVIKPYRGGAEVEWKLVL
eukprot:TRINITY_DN21359_c0_g1_i1.p1 TRINITY_DN21359_c0_g1~~TRINITY_DN21359_c0_g1_i1.p1  ORF type:complete len:361 (+),score=58.60 TRINITY_DN21359_c0_g1_i1:22-1083(+)